MADTGAIIGGDCDGAFYLRDRWFGSDDAIYAAARLTEIVSNEGALTDLIASLPETSLRVLPLGDNSRLHAALWALLSEEANFAGARVSREWRTVIINNKPTLELRVTTGSRVLLPISAVTLSLRFHFLHLRETFRSP